MVLRRTTRWGSSDITVGMLLFRCIVILATTVSVFAKDKQTPKVLADQIRQGTFTLGENIPPFHQTVHFAVRVPNQQEVAGEIVRDRLDGKHLRRRITAGGYDASYVQNGELAYVKTSAPAMPPILGVIEGKVQPPLQLPNDLDAKLSSSKVFLLKDEPEANCLEVKSTQTSFCVNSNGQMVREEWSGNTLRFTQFQNFGGKQIPSHFELLTRDGIQVIGDLETTAAPDLTPALFQPPVSAGFEELAFANCAGGKHPEAISTPDPAFPRNAIEGTVVLWLIVGADGQPHDIRIARSLSAVNDAEAIKAISGWKFKPAICSGKSQAVQINVEVNFRK